MVGENGGRIEGKECDRGVWGQDGQQLRSITPNLLGLCGWVCLASAAIVVGCDPPRSLNKSPDMTAVSVIN